MDDKVRVVHLLRQTLALLHSCRVVMAVMIVGGMATCCGGNMIAMTTVGLTLKLMLWML